MPSDKNDSSQKTIHVKKYGNRRLYSSTDTRFVTIQELAQAVRQGVTVRVTDAETDDDITSEILTQILLEGGRAQHFPVELLEKMIRLNEQALQSFWGGYFEQSRKVFENFQENWQKISQANLFFQWSDRQWPDRGQAKRNDAGSSLASDEVPKSTRKSTTEGAMGAPKAKAKAKRTKNPASR